jgi:hypothetical protein
MELGENEVKKVASSRLKLFNEGGKPALPD